nr:reverse transcriptase domain-containing protein [Tanacetum cinerariifolium]
MSSDNAQSTVTYTSISSYSDGPSWGIPLMNVNELPEIDPYEEVAQQGEPHADDASPTAESPRYIAYSDSMGEDDDEDHEEDPKPPGCDVAESSAAIARAPRGQYDFVDTVEAGQGYRSPGHDAWTIARAADRAKDVGYVKALHASKHRMMTFIEEVNLRISYQAQVRRQEMRGQRTAYETELQEVHQAYLSSKARNKALLARLETLETHISRKEWPVQPARVCSYIDFMKCQPLNFKGTEGVVGLSQWVEKMESVFHINGCAIDNQMKFATCTLLGAALTWWNSHGRTLGHDAAYAMT